MRKYFIIILIFISFFITSCSDKKTEVIMLGYGEEEINVNLDVSSLYIAGYKNGVVVTGVLDYPKAKAVYLNYYGNDVLMISVDCIGLSNDFVNKIRKKLNLKCDINVSATHTHAGIDTLGLWGPIGIDGKNEYYMNLVLNACYKAGMEAFDSKTIGSLTYGKIQTEGVLIDSRENKVYDETMYQLRFIPKNDSESTRMVFYGAHAESLRGDNTLLSADFPGVMARIIKESCNDNFIYFNGAIGGLIMTDEFYPDAVMNMEYTGKILADYALSIKEEEISGGSLKQVKYKFNVRLDNTLFLYYKFLGILKNESYKNIFTNHYYLKSELSVLKIADLTFVLMPGEIFPELVYGNPYLNEECSSDNPNTLLDIAKKYDIKELIIVGLTNDELGYIVPPSDYLLNNEYPYINNYLDSRGENHYEETNSVSIELADSIADVFNKCLKKLCGR